MNFLSHFYFDRHSEDPHLILGIVMPDLLKNANKTWTLHPAKKEELLSHDRRLLSLLEGWNRHIQVDKHFHASDFFCQQTGIIRKAIVPLLEGSPVRPSFLSHIALEIMLDSLLITEMMIEPDHFYRLLKKVDRSVCEEFLVINGITDINIFFAFFDRFIDSAYLNSYRDPENIVYALNRICMRVWDDPLSKKQQSELSEVLIAHENQLRLSFSSIFRDIDKQLRN